MAVSDLFATQNMYNQRGLYQDTPESNQAWKTAFDIANNFAGTAEKFRAHDENLATSAYRVAATNAQNQKVAALAPWETKSGIATAQKTIELAPWETKSGIANAQKIINTTPSEIAALNAKNGVIANTAAAQTQALLAYYASQAAQGNLQTNQYNGQNELLKYYGTHGFDPSTGVWRSPEELRYLGQGADLSPFALAQIQNPMQKVSPSTQVDLRTQKADFSKALQDAISDSEDKVLTYENFLPRLQALEAIYGKDNPELINFVRQVSQSYGWDKQLPLDQNAVPVGGIAAPNTSH